MQEQFPFITEAEKTASNFFHTDRVSASELYTQMRKCVVELDILDKMRKAIYYENRQFESAGAEIPAALQREYPEGFDPHIIHGILGSACEGAEKLDLLVRVFDGEEFDPVNYCEEVGDGWFYDAIALVRLGITDPEVIMRAVIAKIQQARLKGSQTFDKGNFNERNLLTEREVLEEHLLPALANGKVRVRKDD